MNPTGTARPDEEVGTGDNSNASFYLDHACVIDATYNVYYGSASGSGTALTETTHFTLNKETGALTLTAAGVTAIGTNKLWANYKYNDLQLTPSQIQDALDNAQSDIDQRTNTHWANSSDTTPDWGVVADEKHSGKGGYDRDYYLLHFPLPLIQTAIAGTAVVAADTTLWVSSTAGFPATGTLAIESEKITYTGKTATTFTGCATFADAHAVDSIVSPVVIELSTSDPSAQPTWTVLQPDTDFDINLNTGRVHIYKDEFRLDPYGGNNPPKIPNRFRACYLYGHSDISADVKELCCLIAAKRLAKSMARRALLTNNGKGVSIEGINIDDAEIDNEINRLKSWKSSAL